MRIPFEHDTPADPIAPTDQAADTDTATPIEDPVADDLTPNDPTDAGPADPPITDRPDEPVAPSAIPPVTPDPGAAQRRITMQLYSRMVTDLKVLTGDKRVPTDAEIDEALNRATRALGVWQPARQDAVWRTSVNEAPPAPHFASYDPADPAHRLPILAGASGQGDPSNASSAHPFESENLGGFADDAPAQATVAGQGPANIAIPASPADPRQQAKAADAADLAPKTGPQSLDINMSDEDFALANGSPWDPLAPPPDKTKAEKDAEKKQKDERKRENRDRRKQGLPEIPAPPKSRFEQRDLDDELTRQLKKPGSTNYDPRNPAMADYVLRIAKATATAKTQDESSELEKAMVIGPDPARPGRFRVKWIGLMGRNGGRIPATSPGDVIVHVHPASKEQAPNQSDFSSALDGRVSYVINENGTKVWEVRRNGKSIAINPKNLRDRLQGVEVGRLMPGGKTRYERFQIKSDQYSPGNR